LSEYKIVLRNLKKDRNKKKKIFNTQSTLLFCSGGGSWSCNFWLFSNNCNPSTTSILQVHRFSLIIPQNLTHFIESHMKSWVHDVVAHRLNWSGAMGKTKISDFAVIQALRGNKKKLLSFSFGF
jgi:hypothetical protein